MRVATILDAYHAAGNAIAQHVYRYVGEGDGNELVDGIRFATALVRTEGGSLPRDKFLGASDSRGKTDAVLGPLNVIVHGLGDGNYGHPGGGKSRGEAQRIVAADGYEATNPEPLKIFQDDGC